MLNGAPVLGAIEATGLTKVYGALTAVSNIGLSVQPGEIYGFLGPNGAGKTTTIKMLVGLLKPTAGTARICGYDVQRQALDAKACLGYVPDSPFIYEKMRGHEFLTFMARLYRVEPDRAHRRADELLRLFDLTAAADRLVEGYSHGMRQKLALAGALIHRPSVLFLDEPTVGLDPKSARLIKDLLRQLRDSGVAVLMSTHILEIAENMCDRVGIIQGGRLVAEGTVAELRHRQGGAGSLEDIFLSLTGGADYAELAQVLA
jgi:ABC-2 type transport system ATP-binding protein